jgi:hypothetical protein
MLVIKIAKKVEEKALGIKMELLKELDNDDLLNFYDHYFSETND